LDTTQETACKLSNTINGEECDEEFVLDTMAELTNIVSGNGITTVNNANSGMGLMLTPPSIFIGNELTIVSPKLNAEVVTVTTPLGLINLVSALKEGSSQWMQHLRLPLSRRFLICCPRLAFSR
jgi:CheY-specific phosphatase CheX